MPPSVTWPYCLIAFVIGGIPIGWLVGRARGVDLRHGGSGNIGATNAARLLGIRWGIIVFVLDVTKGLIPTWYAGGVILAAGDSAGSAAYAGWLLVGICAVLGHNFSPFLGFRGGKGVATSLGAALGVHPHLTLPVSVAAAVWMIVVALFRVSAVGSLSAAVAFPLAYLVQLRLQDRRVAAYWPFVAFALIATVMIVIRHQANIARWRQGNKPPVGESEGG